MKPPQILHPPAPELPGPSPLKPHRELSKRSALLILVPILGVALTLRVARLSAWPVFCDEDIYTSVLAEMRDASWVRALELPAEMAMKPPLVFLLRLALAGAGLDLVRTGRLLSALLGVVTTFGCYELGRRLGGRTLGLLTATAYALAPLAVLHERMALLDGPMAPAVLGATLSGWAAVDRKSWALAGISAVLGALAVLCKPSALLNVAVVGAVPNDRRRPGPLLALSMAGPVGAYAALRYGPLGTFIVNQEASHWAWGLGLVREHLIELGDCALVYLPWGLWALVPLGLWLLARFQPSRVLLPSVALAAWIVPWILLSEFTPSRYYLPALPHALVLACLAALTLVRAAGRWRLAAIVAAALIAVGSASTSLRLVFQHRSAPMTQLDDWQYRSGWPSGYGFAEARNALLQQAEPGSRVAYLLLGEHRTAAGFWDPLPAGVSVLGFFNLREPDALKAFPPRRRRTIYVLADGRLDVEPARLAPGFEILCGAAVLARFPRPGSNQGPILLRLPAGPTCGPDEQDRGHHIASPTP